ncbi:hypothetical protein E3Q06_02932 [Wallemia mellicola]|nr:hypothetical protein E3Q21_02945 [Wallemia mellicola]TIB86220.1 hypothetical protein E3Q20_02937 [Wallemia mellicola]TIC47693.1 hypothetical protein E3Q06_02932 [Wallemia mellicola]
MDELLQSIIDKRFDKNNFKSLAINYKELLSLPLDEYTVHSLVELDSSNLIDDFFEKYYKYFLDKQFVRDFILKHFSHGISSQLVAEHLNDNRQCTSLLIEALPDNYNEIYTSIEHNFDSQHRLKLLQLTLSLVSQQPIHSHHLIHSELFQLILISSLIDLDSSIISLINCILSILLPKYPQLLSNYVPTFLALVGRTLVWKRRKNDFIQNEILSGLSSSSSSSYNLTVKPTKLSQIVNQTAYTPSTTPLFTFLYGIFPSNTLAFLRSPIDYLQSYNFDNPYYQDLEHWLFVDLIKARSLPLLRTHLIHPFFLKYTLNDPHHELSQTNQRWPDPESQAILAQCAVLEINAATIVEYGRRIAEGIIVDGNTLLDQENANLSQLDSQVDQSMIYLPESKALRDSIQKARADHAVELKKNDNDRDVDLERDFTYEQYIKGQLLMRLGQLHRRRLAEARDEDAQQSLYIHLRELSSRLSQAQAALSNARSEAAKTHARHVTWTDELQRKVKYFREEKKNWDAEAVGLRGERSAAEEIIRVNLGRLADSGNRIFELENQIREWQPKIEEFDKLDERNKDLVKSLAARDDDLFRHDEQRREMQILLGRFNQLKTMTKAERDARIAAENEARKSRNESDQLKLKNEHLEGRLREVIESREKQEIHQVKQAREYYVPDSNNTALQEEILTLRSQVERLEAEKREGMSMYSRDDDESSDEDVVFTRRESSRSPLTKSPSVPPISLFPASLSNAWTQSQPTTPQVSTASNEALHTRTRHVRSPTLSSAPSVIAGLGLGPNSRKSSSERKLSS